ncbi:MAG: glyoxylate/hydroxypyruvate reductase A [Alphaproteobacteria bacterium]|nr:glyoxylate/hydroxypyruvate reductase A [Alphaproteobacteria bacterium]
MAILFIAEGDDPADYRPLLDQELGGVDFRIWPEAGDAAEIEAALVWKPPAGVLRRFPNLKAIISLGAGVDHVFLDPELPRGVPMVRLVDRSLTEQMCEYAILGVLRHHRLLPRYEALQRAGEWRKYPAPDTERTPVGILGLGVIGGAAAGKLAALGFPVRGWSRSAKALPGIACFHGAAGLSAMLAECRFLLCFLPLTPETRGIIDRTTLAALPQGAYVINLARGGHVVDEDLIAALDSGHIAGAMLDVFQREPLPPDHAFWRHPAILLTPHIAGLTVAASVVPQIAETIRRARAGKPLANVVDPERQY